MSETSSKYRENQAHTDRCITEEIITLVNRAKMTRTTLNDEKGTANIKLSINVNTLLGNEQRIQDIKELIQNNERIGSILIIQAIYYLFLLNSTITELRFAYNEILLQNENALSDKETGMLMKKMSCMLPPIKLESLGYKEEMAYTNGKFRSGEISEANLNFNLNFTIKESEDLKFNGVTENMARKNPLKTIGFENIDISPLKRDKLNPAGVGANNLTNSIYAPNQGKIQPQQKPNSGNSLNLLQVGILGCGNIGGQLLKYLINLKDNEKLAMRIVVSTRRPEVTTTLFSNLDSSVDIVLDNERVFSQSDIIFICTQSHQFDLVTKEVFASFKERINSKSIYNCAGVGLPPVIISFMAGVSTAKIKSVFNEPKLIVFKTTFQFTNADKDNENRLRFTEDLSLNTPNRLLVFSTEAYYQIKLKKRSVLEISESIRSYIEIVGSSFNTTFKKINKAISKKVESKAKTGSNTKDNISYYITNSPDFKDKENNSGSGLNCNNSECGSQHIKHIYSKSQNKDIMLSPKDNQENMRKVFNKVICQHKPINTR